jgi:hypothetical protein
MAKTNPTASREILEAALHGLELQQQKLEEQIAQVRSMLGRRVGRPPKVGSGGAEHEPRTGRGVRKLSEEARKRIAAAQKKRWAAFRKSTGKKA